MLSLTRIASFALLVFSLLAVAQASPASRREATNAERFARGLTPARPRRLYSGSRTNVARSAPSNVPGSVYAGKVGVYPASTAPLLRKRTDALGYLGAYGIETGVAQAWTYQYTQPTSGSVPVELNHPGSPYRLSGVAIRSGPDVTLGLGNSYYLQLQNSRAHTAAGSPTATYVYDTYAIGYAQTTIFHVDSTGKVLYSWVNPDGSIAPQYLYASGNALYITGDPTALQQQLGASSIAPVVSSPSFRPWRSCQVSQEC
ncbi:hypothetical protein BC628DRAFT_1331731 [Trametes gibbosa]|nr:hypothetical protein BC628DRAFT_1331731 [Trametes gibbosa]